GILLEQPIDRLVDEYALPFHEAECSRTQSNRSVLVLCRHSAAIFGNVAFIYATKEPRCNVDGWVGLRSLWWVWGATISGRRSPHQSMPVGHARSSMRPWRRASTSSTPQTSMATPRPTSARHSGVDVTTS